jgi:hypothetical protein
MIVSLAVLFVVVAFFIILRDRKDWFGYAVIILGSMFIGTMPIGPQVTGWLITFGIWLDGFIMSILT